MTEENGKIIAYVVGSDTSIMMPLVSGFLRVLLFGKLKIEKVEGVDVVVVPVLRSNAQEPIPPLNRVNELFFEWSQRTDPALLGFESSSALFSFMLELLDSYVFMHQVHDVSPDITIITDDASPKNPWEYPLFDDGVGAHRILHKGSAPEASAFSGEIAQDLAEKVWHDFDLLLASAVERSEAESKIVKFPKSGTRVESILPILESIDLNYTPDIALIGTVVDNAAMTLFKDLEPSEYNIWLLSCLITGIQARLPEVATMWAKQSATKSPE